MSKRLREGHSHRCTYSWSMRECRTFDQSELLSYFWPIRALVILLTNQSSCHIFDQSELLSYFWPIRALVFVKPGSSEFAMYGVGSHGLKTLWLFTLRPVKTGEEMFFNDQLQPTKWICFSSLKIKMFTKKSLSSELAELCAVVLVRTDVRVAICLGKGLIGVLHMLG